MPRFAFRSLRAELRGRVPRNSRNSVEVGMHFLMLDPFQQLRASRSEGGMQVEMVDQRVSIQEDCCGKRGLGSELAHLR